MLIPLCYLSNVVRMTVQLDTLEMEILGFLRLIILAVGGVLGATVILTMALPGQLPQRVSSGTLKRR
ncbi:MAG: hypothetical protein M3O09_12825 [Acidobacteriota bacterium]|nr:hypothetical protein [Acidobacteriota bacterium]